MIRKFLDLKCNRGVRASLVSGSAVQPQLQSSKLSIFSFREMESSSIPQQQGVQHQLHVRNSWKGNGSASATPANIPGGFKVPKPSFGGAGAGAGLQNCPFQFGSIEPDYLTASPHSVSSTNEPNGLPEMPPSAVVPDEAYAPTLDGVNREFMPDGKKALDAGSSGVTEPEAAALVHTIEGGEGTEPLVDGGGTAVPSHADTSPDTSPVTKELPVDGGKAVPSQADISPVTKEPPSSSSSSGTDTGRLSSAGGEAGGESIVNSAAVTDGASSPLERQESPAESGAALDSSESDDSGAPKAVGSPWNSSRGMNGSGNVRVSTAMPNSRPSPAAEASVFTADDFPELGTGPPAKGAGRGKGGGGGGGAVNALSFGGMGAARSAVVVQAQQQAHPPADDPSKSQQQQQPSSLGKQRQAESSRAPSGLGGRGGSPHRNPESGNSDVRRGGGGGGGAGNRRQTGGDERRNAAGQRHGSPNARGEKDSVDALGRLLTRILRHQALELGLNVRSDGFVSVKELLNLEMKTRAKMSLSAYTVEDVLQAVKLDNKQRLGTKEDNGELFIRANQGHTIESIESEQLLKPVMTANDIPGCVHGTYNRYLDAIFKEGLKRMSRRHVHFATGLYGSSDVISGMRKSCEVLVHLDVEKALADGMKLYISENGVVLTEGFDGVVPPDYFKEVLRLPDMKPITPRSKQSY